MTTKKAEHIAAFFEPPGKESLLAGVGPADVHNRAPREIPVVSSVGGTAGLSTPNLTRLDAKQRQLATFIIQGWTEARDRLRSGVFTVRGRQFASGTGKYPSLDVPIEIFCAFDYDRDVFRYDGRKPQRVSTDKVRTEKEAAQRAKGPGLLSFVERDIIEKYARGPTQAITWCSVNPNTVGFHPVSFSMRGKWMLPPFDVRIVGLGLWDTVVEGRSYSDLRESLSKWEMEDAADEGGGQYRCVWISVQTEFRKEEMRHRVWFDERQGFAPVRSEFRITRAAIPGFPAEDSLHQESDATWACIHEVWVPKTFSIRLFINGSCRERRDSAFEWNSVNEPVDSQLFELAAMELPPQARIFDDRLGAPVIIGRVRDFQIAPPVASHSPAGATAGLPSSAAVVGDGVLAKAPSANVVFCQLPPYIVSRAEGAEPSFVVTGDDAADGKQSALLTMGSVTGQGAQFGQTIKGGSIGVGKTYTFAAMVKPLGGPVSARLEIERPARPWDRAVKGPDVRVEGNDWTELHVTFKVDKPFAEGWFAYLSCAQEGARLRADLFRLYEGDYVPAKPSGQGRRVCRLRPRRLGTCSATQASRPGRRAGGSPITSSRICGGPTDVPRSSWRVCLATWASPPRLRSWPDSAAR